MACSTSVIKEGLIVPAKGHQLKQQEQDGSLGQKDALEVSLNRFHHGGDMTYIVTHPRNV